MVFLYAIYPVLRYKILKNDGTKPLLLLLHLRLVFGNRNRITLLTKTHINAKRFYFIFNLLIYPLICQVLPVISSKMSAMNGSSVAINCNNNTNNIIGQMTHQNGDEKVTETNGNGIKANVDENDQMPELYAESKMAILDTSIGYCRYGKGPVNFLFICGGVGCYKKDYPEAMLRHFDPEQFSIVCIDPPGYGTSRPPDRKQEIHRCKKDAQYCLKLMEALEMTPFAVLGWSEGGRTAIHVGGQGKQQMVSHIILLSTSTQVDFRGDMAFKGMRNTSQWMPSAKAVYLEHYSEQFLKEQWAALCDVVSLVYKDLGGRFPSDQVLSTLKMPVLVINGAQDRFVLDPKLMTKKIQNARIELHAQGGHDLHIKYPRWFALTLSKFVKETTGKEVTNGVIKK